MSHLKTAIILISFLFCILAGAANLVTETLGQVGDHVITSREVKISTILERLLFAGNTDFGQLQQMELLIKEEAFLRGALTSVLLESVVALEAESFNVSEVSDSEIQAVLAKVEGSLGKKTYWQQLEVSSSELKSIIKRKYTAKSFLKFKTSSMTSVVTDQEAEAYFEKNRIKFGSVPFANFKENIKAFLGQQQLEDRLRAWFEVIKRKHRVRNLLVG